MITKILSASDGLHDSLLIRIKVFVEEQNVPLAMERDEYDETATFALIYDELNKPIATGRMIFQNGNYFIGRVAVLPEYRGKGLGAKIMQMLIDAARQRDIKEIIIHAQTHAKKFYQKLGFKEFGDVYDEAGIEHISMKIEL